MIHLAICDDERTQTEYLTGLARDWAAARGDAVRVSAFLSAEAFLFAYEEEKQVDILLLDIQMEGMDGVALARRICAQSEAIQIIFVTGYPDYTLEGYDVGALHYLMKPVCPDKLFQALDRAARQVIPGRSILIETDEGAARVRMDEIESIETVDRLLEMHIVREKMIVRMPLHVLEGMLGPDFVRCHRCCVVNMRFVRKITRNEVLLDSGRALPLSRRLYADVNRALFRHVRGGNEL